MELSTKRIDELNLVKMQRISEPYE